ncbi:putative glutamine amidotransferase-like protein YfeJ [Ceratocystis fimbriata CBS 114723]|uniref:Putative glutamine amidotransferase-like protein YfeJ n=1 Tax=Ceratocystis fimbriata CBS 114723 TaxID=1035309 RepID=A0A2C5WTW8_9PEZI|nr:putative glutamine amidotransferase-like protein YfeJ [Ceratocystis fimbriata CBS 114723]
MLVHFIVHESFEAPGAYETWALSRGYDVTFTRLYLGDTLPFNVGRLDALIILGGPQNPSTTKDECPYFDAPTEKNFILQCIKAGKAVVGICLGSQLVGEALGAAWEKSPETEIGSFPITLTTAGRNNDKFKHFGHSEEVGHWHNDMPGLTPDAKIIALSQGCPRQIVEYTNLVYGFQCHMEFTSQVIEGLIEASKEELQSLTGRKYVQQPNSLRANDYGKMNAKLMTFLDCLIKEYSMAQHQ